MKKSGRYLVMALALGLLAEVPALAQLSVSGSGGYGPPAQPGSSGMWGGGLAAKYYFAYKLAVGVSARGYVESIAQTDGGLDGGLTAVTLPIMATVDYHFTDTDLHPYVGLEAGVIRSALITNLDFNGRNIYDDTRAEYLIGLAPKVGVGYDLTQGLMVTAEALYNVGLGKNQAGNPQLDLEKLNRFLTIHVGLSFTFGNRFDWDRIGK